MGLKNLEAWNNTLIAKTLWKIHMKKDSLWVKWVNHTYSQRKTVWEWGWHKDEFPIIKQIIHTRDELIRRVGPKEGAIICLEKWFGEEGGLSKTYEFFVKKIGVWPWKPIVWKSSILPKHRFTLWLFTHGKLLTKDRQPYVDDKMCAM